MSAFVVRTNQLDIETVEYTRISNDKKTGKPKAFILNKSTGKTFAVETPELTCQFGPSVWDAGNGQDPSKVNYSLELRVDYAPESEESEEESEAIKNQRRFMAFIQGLDEMAISYMLENSQELFKKKYPQTDAGREVVRALYSPLVKVQMSKDGNTRYNDKIKLKLNHNEDFSGPDSNLLIFKDSAKPITVESWNQFIEMIPKGTKLKAIVQPQIILMPGKFFLKLKLIQMKIPNVQRVSRPIGYAFSDPVSEQVEESNNANAKTSTHADDSDDENNEAEIIEDN